MKITLPLKRISYWLLLSTILLMACGEPDNADTVPQSGIDRSAHNWKTEDWQRSDGIYAGGNYYVEKYISGLEFSPEQECDSHSTTYRCWGANFYALDTFSTLTGETWQYTYYLNGYEDTTGEIWHQQIDLPELTDYEGMEKYVAAYDIQDPQEYVLFVQISKGDDTHAFLAMHFSFDGEYLDAVDLYPAMQAGGISLENRLSLSEIYVDCEGRCFLIPPFDNDKVIVLDSEGEMLTELAWNKGKIPFSFLMKTAEGEPVFEQRDTENDGEMRLVMYDPATGGEMAFTEQLPYSDLMGITGDGILYYGEQGLLRRWDLYTGDRGTCFNYGELGLGKNMYRICVGISDTNFPLILDHSRGKAIICKLGDEPGEEADPIRLVSLVEDSAFIASSAILFSQEHAEHPILTQQPEDDQEAFRSRAMADLVAGNGADIYYVSGEDMRMLYEKGVLADLSGVLENDKRKSLYEGVLSCGVIDSRQVGLAPEAYVTTLMVSDELWPEENWTLEEALALMDAHPEFRKIMVGGTYMAKIHALQLLLLQDLPGSPFLEMDTGTCSFDNPLFVKALETINQSAGGMDKGANLTKSGKSAAYQVNMESFWDFSADMSDLGEGFHPVGFPTGTGNGSYWNADYFLVVSARAEHRDLIDAYLASLFDRERQVELSHPVRNDLVDTQIYHSEYSPISPWSYNTGGGIYIPLATKPDGSLWTEEYKDILSRAVPRPQNTYYIEDIILEEAASYLSGVKTAEQVAEIIQNRVQLYLNEQQ